MKKRRLSGPACLCGLWLTLLFLYPSAAASGAKESLALFVTSVLPVVLPFFTVTSCLCLTGFAQLLSPVGAPLCRLFRLPRSLGGKLLLSLLSGTPNGARLLRESSVPPELCLRFLAASTAMSPLFCVSVAGGFLGDGRLGLLLYAVSLLSLLPLCLFCPKGVSMQLPPLPESAPLPFFRAFPRALASSCSACLSAAGSMALFGSVRGILSATGLVSALERITLFYLPSAVLSPVLSGLLEVSIGVRETALSPLSLPLRLSLLCGLCAFGGLSMALQVLSLLPELSAKRFLLQRILHGGLAFLLCRGLLLLLPVPFPVFAGSSSCGFSYSLFAAAFSISFALLLPLLILLHKRKKARPMKGTDLA